jgi:hypothetical protein
VLSAALLSKSRGATKAVPAAGSSVSLRMTAAALCRAARSEALSTVERLYDSLLCAGICCVVSSSSVSSKMTKHSTLIHSTRN